MTWPQRFRLAIVVVVAVVLHTTLFSGGLRVFDVMPDLGLVLAVGVAYYLGPERGAAFGFVSGLAIDLFLNTPFGLSALSFALVGYGIGVVQSGLVRSSRWVAPIMGGLGGLAGGALFVCIGALAGREELLSFRSVKVVLIASVYDALLAFVAFPIARWATRAPSGEVRGWTGRGWVGR